MKMILTSRSMIALLALLLSSLSSQYSHADNFETATKGLFPTTTANRISEVEDFIQKPMDCKYLSKEYLGGDGTYNFPDISKPTTRIPIIRLTPSGKKFIAFPTPVITGIAQTRHEASLNKVTTYYETTVNGVHFTTSIDFGFSNPVSLFIYTRLFAVDLHIEQIMECNIL